MNRISLYAEGIFDVTIVPNTFIDFFMPSANGAYVKVYLYLLRNLGSNNNITISSIADHLENTEKDIIRALNYWEKQNLLKIEKNTSGEITALYLADLSAFNNTYAGKANIGASYTNNTYANTDNEEPALDEIAISLQTETELAARPNYNTEPVARTAYNEPAARSAYNAEPVTRTAYGTEPAARVNLSTEPVAGANFDTETAARPAYDIEPVIRPAYSQEKINELTNQDEIKKVMHIVELYLERPLKPVDIQLILYLYEELKFPSELITYLYEYCVSKNKKSPSYIEAVALEWAKEGIDTEEKAREATLAYNDHVNNVIKAFGLNRAPGQIERQYITKWVDVYSFSDEIITEACNRTILRTQKPDFKYTDKILETWYKKGAKSMDDIARLDEEFSKGGRTKAANNVTPIAKQTPNKFNQFPQRTYTAKDYAELERKLINKGL